MSKKRFLATLVVLVVVGFIFSGAQAAEKVKFGTSIRAAPHYELVLTAADERGFWKQNNLDVEWVPFRSGSDMHRGVAAGSIDMGLSQSASVVQATERGIPEIIVASTLVEDFYIYVLKKSAIREPKELKGARVALGTFGGAAHAYARLVLKSLGLEKETKLIAAGGITERMAALKSEGAEAMIIPLFSVANLVAQGEVREVLAVRDYLPKEWVDQVIYARKDFAQKNPGLVKSVIRAFLQTAGFVMKNPEWATTKMKGMYGFTDEAASIVHKALQYHLEGRVDKKGVENLRNFLIEYGIIKKEKAPPVEELYTNEYLG